MMGFPTHASCWPPNADPDAQAASAHAQGPGTPPLCPSRAAQPAPPRPLGQLPAQAQQLSEAEVAALMEQDFTFDFCRRAKLYKTDWAMRPSAAGFQTLEAPREPAPLRGRAPPKQASRCGRHEFPVRGAPERGSAAGDALGVAPERLSFTGKSGLSLAPGGSARGSRAAWGCRGGKRGRSAAAASAAKCKRPYKRDKAPAARLRRLPKGVLGLITQHDKLLRWREPLKPMRVRTGSACHVELSGSSASSEALHAALRAEESAALIAVSPQGCGSAVVSNSLSEGMQAAQALLNLDSPSDGDDEAASMERDWGLVRGQIAEGRSEKEAAASLGICVTKLKRICRAYGCTRWPARRVNCYRHIRVNLELSLRDVEAAADNPDKVAELKKNLAHLRAEEAALLENPALASTEIESELTKRLRQSVYKSEYRRKKAVGKSTA